MYRFYRAFFKAASYLPFWLLYILSDMLYGILYYIVRYRRKVVRKNLEESFPEMSPKQLRRLERKFYRFFVDMALESMKVFSISEEEIKKRMKFANIEDMNEILRSGKSIALFIGHFGNWEWITSMGLALDPCCVPSQIYHKLRNKNMDRLMIEVRERWHTKCVAMHDTVRYVARESKAGKPLIIGFIADQSPKKREVKDFFDFLNHRAPSLTGTEKLVKHFGFEAVFVSMKRVRRGYYETTFEVLHDDPASLPDFELTQLYYNRLEREIRERPELYLWTHKRFKHAIAAN